MANFEYINGPKLFYRCQGLAEVGRSAGHLIVSVALTQDTLRGKAVRWSNMIAMMHSGVASRDAFFCARNRAVSSGWLSYVSRGSQEAGEYRFTVPEIYRSSAEGSSGSKNGTDSVPDLSAESKPELDIKSGPISTSTDTQTHLSAIVESDSLQNRLKTINRNKVRERLASLGVPLIGKYALSEWCGLTTKIIDCTTVDGALESIDWLVNKARKEGRTVKFMSDVLDFIFSLEAHRIKTLRQQKLDRQKDPG